MLVRVPLQCLDQLLARTREVALFEELLHPAQLCQWRIASGWKPQEKEDRQGKQAILRIAKHSRNGTKWQHWKRLRLKRKQQTSITFAASSRKAGNAR
jgi:hypothetical protein